LPHIKFILPNASVRNVHVLVAGAPGETELPAWWDPQLAGGIPSSWPGKDTPIGDVTGLKDAKAKIESIIEEEAKLVEPGRIVLGGFSQGTTLSLAVGLENDKVGRIIGNSSCFLNPWRYCYADIRLLLALSSALSVPDSFKSVGTTDPSTLKKAIFWAHGTADYVPLNCEFPEFFTLISCC
jgi:lysophospholipase-1